MTLFLAWLIGPIGRWFLVAGLVGGSLWIFGEYQHHTGYSEGIAELEKYKLAQSKLAAAQAIAVNAIETQQEQGKQNADKVDMQIHNDAPIKSAASVKRLRDSNASAYRLSQAAATAGSPGAGQVCYNAYRLTQGLRDADNELSQGGLEIVGRGQTAVEELQLAKAWSLSLPK